MAKYDAARNIRAYRNAGYNYTSEAYDYDRIRRSRQRQLPKANQKIQYVEVGRTLPLHTFKIVFSLFVVVSFLVLILALNANNLMMKSKNAELESTLAALVDDNTQIETELSKNIDIEQVQRLAETKLGMKMPSDYQVVYIDVPVKGYAVSYNDSVAQKDEVNGMISVLSGIFGN